MNTIVTSREAILARSRELIRQSGAAKLNIRALARECGISVGSVYNYFGSKAELLAAGVESVWSDIFELPFNAEAFDSFADCALWLLERARRGSARYPGFLTLHAQCLTKAGAGRASQLMEATLGRIREGLGAVLARDAGVRENAFDAELAPQALVETVLAFILAALIKPEQDLSGLKALLRRVLYT